MKENSEERYSKYKEALTQIANRHGITVKQLASIFVESGRGNWRVVFEWIDGPSFLWKILNED